MVKSSIVFSRAAVDIVTKPYLVGAELEALALQASTDFVAALEGAAEFENPVSLEILNGGHYYFVKDAFTAATGKACGLSSLRAKRRFDEETQEWKVRVWEEAGVPPQEAGVLLVGDTVATGTTLNGVLSRCIDRMEEANHFCDIVLFCIAGSPVCEAHLDKLQPRLEAHGKSISIYYANAKFNLADNGTDLGFDGAEFNEEAKALIDEAVGSFASKMKCAVWDWGDRFREQEHHLTEILEYFEGVDGAPEELLTNIKTRLKAVKDASAAAADAGEDESKA